MVRGEGGFIKPSSPSSARVRRTGGVGRREGPGTERLHTIYDTIDCFGIPDGLQACSLPRRRSDKSGRIFGFMDSPMKDGLYVCRVGRRNTFWKVFAACCRSVEGSRQSRGGLDSELFRILK